MFNTKKWLYKQTLITPQIDPRNEVIKLISNKLGETLLWAKTPTIANDGQFASLQV